MKDNVSWIFSLISSVKQIHILLLLISFVFMVNNFMIANRLNKMEKHLQNEIDQLEYKHNQFVDSVTELKGLK